MSKLAQEFSVYMQGIVFNKLDRNIFGAMVATHEWISLNFIFQTRILGLNKILR